MERLQKNDIIEVTVDDCGIDGEGIAHYNGQAVFIKNAIVGERVKAKIILVKPTFYVAVLDKILVSSSSRISAPCPYFGRCGGCSMQHIDYGTQLEFKKSSLVNTLKKQGLADLNISGVCPSEKEFNYRNKLSLPVSATPFSIGFYAKNSHRVVDINDCLLQNFDCKKLIETVRKFMLDNNLSGYDEQSGKGDIRHITARHIDGVIVCAIVTNRPLQAKLRALNEILESRYGNSYALYSNLNTKNTNVIYGEAFDFIGGNDKKLFVDGVKIHVHPAAFFQVNDGVRNALYSYVLSIVKALDCGVILDAYSGAGMLGLRLSGEAKKVVCIEINSEAHIAAKELMRDNGITNAECILGDCAIEIPAVLNRLRLIDNESVKNAAVVLDPPRAGVEKAALESILNSGVKNIIYISCNPATLARDLKILSGCYKINSIKPFDMFPQTSGLETVAFLTYTK